MRVGVLEDDPDQMALFRSVIASLGHTCTSYTTGREMLRALRRESFDLLLLDWSTPDISGIEVLAKYRAQAGGEHVPVLFITNHMEENDIVRALSAGADDYMAKPIRVSELLARINALLRRAYPNRQKDVFEFQDYRFNQAEHTLTVAGVPVELKAKEWELAFLLFSSMGRLLSRSYLLETIWGHEGEVYSRTLNTHISRVRVALNLRPENGFRLSSVYSMGYRLESLQGAVAAVDAPAPE